MLMKYSLEYKHTDSPVKEINLLVKTLKKEREENLKNAFRVIDPSLVKDKKILLIDDIITFHLNMMTTFNNFIKTKHITLNVCSSDNIDNSQ